MNQEKPSTNNQQTEDQPVESKTTEQQPEISPAPETGPSEPLFQTEAETVTPYEETVLDADEVTKKDEYSPEERAALEARYDETMKTFNTSQLVMGKIVSITENEVAVDIGFKSEGNIPVEEFDNIRELKVGDEVEIFIDSIENAEGTLALSKKKAEFTRVWENINELYRTGEMVEAPIIRRIKGGMVVDLFGIEAFLPGSQIDVHPVRDFDALVGATMDFRIIKVNNARKNVVISHKVLVEESLREIRTKVLSELEEGQVVEGVVKNITDFGVFVDLGGVDGLLHITDLSWGRVSHPSDVVKLDEKIKVKVLHYDKERQRISLGLKQLQEQHWDEIEQRYPINMKVKGKVVSIVKYGAFIELEPGVEGLVHISEMSWTQHIKHPSQMVSVADEIDIVILNVDRENRKISLGMKQCEEDPWEKLVDKYIPGTKHKGLVRDLVPFGAFVELEQGIDGLIHISDLSWTRKVRHPGEVVKKGEEIEIVILNFDLNERRIALGYKQLEPDPWDSFEKEYQIRSKTEGSVIRVLEKGVVVMLPLGVEGFIPNSQLGRSLAGENKKNIKDGDNLELEVIEFDKTNHRIVLSHSATERTKDRATFRAYRQTTKEATTTIGDIMRSEEAKKPPAEEALAIPPAAQSPKPEVQEKVAATEAPVAGSLSPLEEKVEAEAEDVAAKAPVAGSLEPEARGPRPDEPPAAEPEAEPEKTEPEPLETDAGTQGIAPEPQVEAEAEPLEPDVGAQGIAPEPQVETVAEPAEDAQPAAEVAEVKPEKKAPARKATKSPGTAKAKPQKKKTQPATKATATGSDTGDKAGSEEDSKTV